MYLYKNIHYIHIIKPMFFFFVCLLVHRLGCRFIPLGIFFFCFTYN